MEAKIEKLITGVSPGNDIETQNCNRIGG